MKKSKTTWVVYLNDSNGSYVELTTCYRNNDKSYLEGFTDTGNLVLIPSTSILYVEEDSVE